MDQFISNWTQGKPFGNILTDLDSTVLPKRVDQFEFKQLVVSLGPFDFKQLVVNLGNLEKLLDLIGGYTENFKD